MATHRNLPTFPVVDEEPPLKKVYTNLTFKDYAYWTVFTLVGMPYGYATGKGARLQSMYFGGLLGFTAGAFYVYQNSLARFKGFRDNTSLQKKYGSTPPPQPLDLTTPLSPVVEILTEEEKKSLQEHK
eukprot:TRINITY_DN6306_c0_g2_i2.p1 TRINITY_DN6306_c0_g2~~TRINITY_DN6306_c0_g2_i2.p1  ORF type:complete len:128 (-),score=27.64 TRINITY_DN6306_c0_g2_i2:45-428(-)